MGLQTRLAYKSANWKRKLVDNKLKKLGLKVGAIQVGVTENRYGDRVVTAQRNDIIIGHVKFPGNEIPIFRAIRQNDQGGFYQNQQTPSSNMSVYDLLPIEGWFPNEAKIERDDIIILRFLDKPSGVAPDADGNATLRWNLMPLQVTEIFGLFNVSMLYTKVQLAPYAFQMDDFTAVQEILSELVTFDVEGL